MVTLPNPTLLQPMSQVTKLASAVCRQDSIPINKSATRFSDTLTTSDHEPAKKRTKKAAEPEEASVEDEDDFDGGSKTQILSKLAFIEKQIEDPQQNSLLEAAPLEPQECSHLPSP